MMKIVSRIAQFMLAMSLLSLHVQADSLKPEAQKVEFANKMFVMRQQVRPLQWDAWAKWVEKVWPVSDDQGHGPDVGSDEWARALSVKVGLSDPDGGPHFKSIDWQKAVEAKLMPEPDADPNRQLLSSHQAIAQFLGVDDRRCMGRTALCPHDCGHSGKVVSFKIQRYEDYQKPGKYGDAKQEIFQLLIEDHKAKRKVGDVVYHSIMALAKNQVVRVRWNHDYVTKDGSKFPERPLIAVTPVNFSVVCSGPARVDP